MTERATPNAPAANAAAPATKAAAKPRAQRAAQPPVATPRRAAAASKPKAPVASANLPAEKPRRVALGDTSGSSQPKKIRKNTVSRVMASRQAAQLAAVQDILSRTENSQRDKAESLRAILEGAAKYASTSDGIVPWRDRPTVFRKQSIARIPPLTPQDEAAE